MTTPHSADALKQQCRAEFEAHIRAKAESEEYATLILQRNGLDEYSTVWVQAEWNGWQAAWNRRPTPASPDLGELRRRMLDAWSNGADKFVIGLGELYALLDRVERAEAALNPYRWTPAMDAAWHRSIPNVQGAFEALREAAEIPLAEAAAGAVPDDPDDDPAFCAWLADHRITDSQKWLAWDAWCRGIESRIAAAPPAQGLPTSSVLTHSSSSLGGSSSVLADQGLPAAPDEPEHEATFCAWMKDQRITASQKWLAWSAWCAGKASAPPVPPAAAPSEPVAWMTPSDWRNVPLATADASVMRAWKSDHRQITPLFTTPPAQDAGTGDATIVAIGYESGFMATDPDHDGATVKLHYRDEATAEAAFCAITRIIDRAIANSGRAE